MTYRYFDQDELERETYGDILTIAVSYLFMFVYITFSLGRITKWTRFLVSNKTSLPLAVRHLEIKRAILVDK